MRVVEMRNRAVVACLSMLRCLVLLLAAVGFLCAADEPRFTEKNELVRLYKKEALTLLAALRTALAARDAVQLRQNAHTLKGISGNLGARRVQALTRTLEHHARANAPAWEALGEGVAQTEAAYAQAQAALERYLAEGNQP